MKPKKQNAIHPISSSEGEFDRLELIQTHANDLKAEGARLALVRGLLEEMPNGGRIVLMHQMPDKNGRALTFGKPLYYGPCTDKDKPDAGPCREMLRTVERALISRCSEIRAQLTQMGVLL